ncbi:DUF262 domain-containing protein [Sphingobacterium gobiense]|uniref:DUF262 domain-containing protein n=1 Tax=Sphingobacterium gobiense TaxID=1382456 RepID=A0A2S9JS04_9SPHI|nr:DUF262 domain-containing protein [Sphingobacterium gobiense]PRD56030.1 hypothetical protein C5749_01700 [Sphingobacterium gobiense]
MSLSQSKVTDNTHEMSFHELFSQTTQIKIPLFQREYVWTEKQFNRMVEEIDVIINGEDTNRFLGAIIAVRRHANPAEPQPYEIVDGQQRLSTLYLFVLAAAYIAARNKHDDYARGIINTNLIIDWWQSGTNTKLVPSFADRNQFIQAYQQLINTGNLSDWLGTKVKLPEKSGNEKGRYISQFNRIKSFLQKRYNENGIGHLQDIITTAQTKLTFVFILLKDPATATTVFEGLNDPGIPIGIGDLVRNEVFSKISDNADYAHTIHRDVWIPFREKLGEHFDKYFFPYAIIREPNINNADLFRGLRKIWGNTSNPENIIDTLEEYSTPYLAIATGKYPNIYTKAIKAILDLLVKSKSPTSIFPFVMKLLKEYEAGTVSEQDTIECLEVLEAFLVRRAITGIEPTGLLAVFRSAWHNMNGKPSKDALKEVILKRNTIDWPDDNRFITAIKTRNLYSSHICTYALLEYDKSIGSDIPENDCWIEHVMPQQRRKWETVISAEDHQNLLNTWGNLIPLTSKMNCDLSDSEFTIKKTEFESHSLFSSARRLGSTYAEWNKVTILERSNVIADWAIKRWPK